MSYWLETEGKSFLFDTGYSNAFLQNAKALRVDVTTADTILLSHGHNDMQGAEAPFGNALFKETKGLNTSTQYSPKDI